MLPNKELYINIKNDHNFLHDGEHLQMLFFNYGFKCGKHNCIWCHPYVITDKGSRIKSFNDVRLRRTAKQYINAGWHVSYCLKSRI